MKIVLCSINSKFIHSSLGVWYLYSAYKETDTSHTVTVYEATINSQTEDIVAGLWQENPDVVGFSCYIWNVEYIKKIAEVLKLLNPKIKIFLGGPEASFDSDRLLSENNYIDIIIKGEGETPFLELLQADFNVKSKVLQHNSGQKCYFNPYSEEYFDRLNGRICYLETSRGCPFSCSFCLSGRDENVRFFDMEVSKKNIIALANSGTQTVKFVDRTFNCDDKRALEIFHFIVKEQEKGQIPQGVIFHFEVEADLFTADTLVYLATVPKGLFQFEAGLQSFNRNTLKAINRRSDITRLVNNLKTIAQSGNIHLHIDLIAGLPYESYTSFVDGFNLAYDIKANVIQLGFLKLLKGSALEGATELHSYRSTPYSPYQVVCNDYITYDELLQLKVAEEAAERLLNSGRFAKTIEFLLLKTKLLPYDLFYSFGEYAKGQGLQSPSLERYSTELFEYFKNHKGVSENELRDVMAFDRITSDKTGKLFPCLHIGDPRLKNVSIAIKNVELDIFENQREKAKGGKIGFCILYSQGKQTVLFADYTDYDPVKNVYNNKTVDLSRVMQAQDI